MKGLELSELFYLEVVKKLIEHYFPSLRHNYAAGLIGYGSDVLGNDDVLSKDHEWGPRCHIWLTNEDYNFFASEIDKMLQDQLPMSYLGHKTRFVFNEEFGALVTTDEKENSFHHVAVTTVERHLELQFGLSKKISNPNKYNLTDIEWLCIPEQKLLELTRGKIFEDPIGEITEVRKDFLYYNEEVWKYKMLYCWREIHNYALIPLCYKRGQVISGKIVLSRVVENIIRLVYLYNRKYYPGYMKWFSYEFYKLPVLANEVGVKLEECLTTEDVVKIVSIIEDIAMKLLMEHNRLEVTPYVEFGNNVSGRGLVNISVWNVCRMLQENITSELKHLNIGGSCDQWITNSDILVWSEQFMKVKDLYLNSKTHNRDGIGDLIV